jgi:GST-like protein
LVLQKVSIGLEELGLPYEAIRINPMQPGGGSGIEKHNINGKIPAIDDPNLQLDGKDLNVIESGAILLHLAERYGNGKLLPTDPAKKSLVVQWLFWQMAGLGPMFGQVNHFWKYAPESVPYAKKRYLDEAKRITGVLEKQLGITGAYVAGDYSIADIAIWPWVTYFIQNQQEILPINADTFPNIARWDAEIAKRPAVIKGMGVLPATPPAAAKQN